MHIQNDQWLAERRSLHETTCVRSIGSWEDGEEAYEVHTIGRPATRSQAGFVIRFAEGWLAEVSNTIPDGWVQDRGDKDKHAEIANFLGCWLELGIIRGTETGTRFESCL